MQDLGAAGGVGEAEVAELDVAGDWGGSDEWAAFVPPFAEDAKDGALTLSPLLEGNPGSSAMEGCCLRSSSMRTTEAVPRWKRLTTQPIAIMGQMSCTIYTLKAAKSPTEMRCRPPHGRRPAG